MATERSSERSEGGRRFSGFGKAREVGEGDREKDGRGGSCHGRVQEQGGAEGRVGEKKEGVINGGADHTAESTQSMCSSREGGVIKMAKADANGTWLGCASSSMGRSQGAAEGVVKNGRAHEQDIVKELHKGGVGVKGDAP